MIDYGELIYRLTPCEAGKDCTDCAMRYEVEVDADELVSVHCAAYEAAQAIKTLLGQNFALKRRIRGSE